MGLFDRLKKKKDFGSTAPQPNQAYLEAYCQPTAPAVKQSTATTASEQAVQPAPKPARMPAKWASDHEYAESLRVDGATWLRTYRFDDVFATCAPCINVDYAELKSAPVSLEQEPSNKYDTDAIKVMFGYPKKCIGYIVEGELREMISDLINADGKVVTIWLIGVDETAEQLTLEIAVYEEKKKRRSRKKADEEVTSTVSFKLTKKSKKDDCGVTYGDNLAMCFDGENVSIMEEMDYESYETSYVVIASSGIIGEVPRPTVNKVEKAGWFIEDAVATLVDSDSGKVTLAFEEPEEAQEERIECDTKNENPSFPLPVFAFLDVETPNRRNDRICSIGIVRADQHGTIVDQDYILVDPEAPFDPLNVEIHGLTAADVRGHGTFADAWPRIRELTEDAVVVAHNATFDLSVLDKCMANYGINQRPIKYACTMHLAGTYIEGIPNCKLTTACEACGIELDEHHNAMSDAKACMGVFFSINKSYDLHGKSGLWSEYVPRAEREAHRASSYSVTKRASTEAMQKLIELCSVIISDGRVSLDEAAILHWWIGSNGDLESKTADDLLEMLSSILEDGAVSVAEEAGLLDALCRIVDPSSESVAGCYVIDGKKFCLTGDFDFGTRDAVTRALESAGGIPCKSVVKTCDYVIVGAKGSEAYAYGSYGTKVQKAMEWQAKGQPVKIVSEHDFALLSE